MTEGAAGAGGVESARERVSAARRLLAGAGLQAEVAAAGLDGEIAAIRAAPTSRARLAELAPEIRSLGFRYVALELKTTEEHGNT